MSYTFGNILKAFFLMPLFLFCNNLLCHTWSLCFYLQFFYFYIYFPPLVFAFQWFFFLLVVFHIYQVIPGCIFLLMSKILCLPDHVFYCFCLMPLGSEIVKERWGILKEEWIRRDASIRLPFVIDFLRVRSNGRKNKHSIETNKNPWNSYLKFSVLQSHRHK